MTEQERINQTLQRQIDAQNARIDTVLSKVDTVIEEIKQQRQDMRELYKRQDEERRAYEAELEEDNRRHETYMCEILANIDYKFDKIIFQIRLASLTMILFSGAITCMILALLK